MRRIPFILFCAWAWIAVFAPTAHPAPRPPHLVGSPPLRVWRAGDYDAAPANWKIVVHPTTNFVYVANDAGLLEFDGASWRRIPLPDDSPARGLTIDPAGRIWVGGHNTICRLEPDATGRFRPISVLATLPPGPQPQGNIGYLAATAEGVFASSGNARQLFQFDPAGPAEVWPLSPDEAFIWVLRDRRDPAGGQMVQLTAAGLVPLLPRNADDVSRRGPRFGLFACRLETDGTWHLRTARGPAHTRGLGHPLTFAPATAGHSFTDDPGTAAVFLSDGRSVYATERAGLLVVDVAGEIVQRLDRSHGLPAARIESLAVDADDGLWVALSDGIARVDFGSPLARHHAPHGITATPRRFASFERQLYLAHGQGLSRRDETTGIFSPVPGFVTTTNGLAQVGGRFVATARGLREVLPATGSRSWLPDDFGPVVAHPRRPGALFAGTPTGLALLTPDRRGGWRVTERSTAIDQAVDELHVTDGVLWAAGRLGALYRIELDDSGRLAAWTVDFGPTHITGWSLGGGGLGTENFRMTFDTLAFTTSAIPEPSTYAALLGLTALALAALRRKTRSRSS